MLTFFCIICAIMYTLHPSPEVYGMSVSNLRGVFSYQFLHGNILHLGVNIASLLLMYKPFKYLFGNKYNYDNDFVLFVIIYIASVLAALVTPQSVPTVGASGMVFFILGAILALRPTKQQFINYIWILLGVIASAIIGNSNTFLHVVAFMLGVLFIILKNTYDNSRKKKYRRV